MLGLLVTTPAASKFSTSIFMPAICSHYPTAALSLAILLVSAQSLVRAALVVAASIVVRRAITRPSVLILASSKALAVSAMRRVILHPSALRSLLISARTAVKKVNTHPISKMFVADQPWQTGHKTSDCKENRKFDRNDIRDETPEDAWAELKKADKERDLEDFREVRYLIEHD